MSEVLEAGATSDAGKEQRLRIAVFIISLRDAEKRRRVITEYLSRVDLPWSFFEGTRYDPQSAPGPDRIEITDGLSNSQIGCFLSHRAVWKEIGNSQLDYAIVLEDDTVLIPSVNFFELFSLFAKLGLGYVRLSSHQIVKANTLAFLGAPFGLICRVILPRYGIGMCSYSLTPDVARRLYQAAARLDDPVDLWIERFSNHGIPIYNFFPAPAVEIRTPTQIQQPPPKQRAFVAYLITRVIRGLLDGWDQMKLSKLDNALRKRADELDPGMAVWPRSELRRYMRRLLGLGR